MIVEGLLSHTSELVLGCSNTRRISLSFTWSPLVCYLWLWCFFFIYTAQIRYTAFQNMFCLLYWLSKQAASVNNFQYKNIEPEMNRTKGWAGGGPALGCNNEKSGWRRVGWEVLKTYHKSRPINLFVWISLYKSRCVNYLYTTLI